MGDLVRNGRFDMTTTGGVSIHIPINNKVTLITGDSATGKTKMVTFLSKLLSDRAMIKSSSVQPENLIVCRNADDFYHAMEDNPVGKLIIADNFDTVDAGRVIDFIRDSENLFILCMHRSLPRCGYSIESMLGLEYQQKSYTAYRLFKTPADYMRNGKVRI